MADNKACWIWCRGDYELFQNLLLSEKRCQKEVDYPVFWAPSTVYPAVVFRKKVTLTKPTKLTVHCNGTGFLALGFINYALNREIELPEGEHTIIVRAINIKGLPAIYINSDELKTDETWECFLASSSRYPDKSLKVGCTPRYTSAKDNVEVFPFSYQRLEPVSKVSKDGGYLYDFGAETYAIVKLKNTDPKDNISIYFGESAEEATDHEYTLIYKKFSGKKSYTVNGAAFRYIHIISELGNDIDFTVDYEYLPIEDKGRFSCDNPMIEQIYSVCSRTLHLNSRAFYLDGIKRDHWAWSGDAYQTYFMGYYLYGDKEIAKRTLVALLGKPPYVQHINAINDYSSYLIISILNYYQYSGDLEFLEDVYDRVLALYQFITSRLDNNGFVIVHSGDWVFIDWADFDKTDPFCAMQILLWETHRAMAQISKVLGKDGSVYLKDADKLRKNIIKHFWCKEKNAFIDSYESGKKNVTRHANIFAIMYGFADEKQKKLIIENVFKNDNVPAVTTPYFKLYELWALCEVGEIEYAEEYIDSYWGGMVRLGATTMWETFDPEEKGTEHYRMYGGKYDRSLCHAWGAGPVFLIGKYVLGVDVLRNEKYKFTVSPNPGVYKQFSGTVPLADGMVKVEYTNGRLSVFTDSEGGAVLIKGKEYPLTPNKEFTIDI